MTNINPYVAGSTPALGRPAAQRARWLSLPVLLLFLALGYRDGIAIVAFAMFGWYSEIAAICLCVDVALQVLGVVLLCLRVGQARHILALAMLAGALMVLDVVPIGINDMPPSDLRDLHVYPPLGLALTNVLLWGLSLWCRRGER